MLTKQNKYQKIYIFEEKISYTIHIVNERNHIFSLILQS